MRPKRHGVQAACGCRRAVCCGCTDGDTDTACPGSDSSKDFCTNTSAIYDADGVANDQGPPTHADGSTDGDTDGPARV